MYNSYNMLYYIFYFSFHRSSMGKWIGSDLPTSNMKAQQRAQYRIHPYAAIQPYKQDPQAQNKSSSHGHEYDFSGLRLFFAVQNIKSNQIDIIRPVLYGTDPIKTNNTSKPPSAFPKRRRFHMGLTTRSIHPVYTESRSTSTDGSRICLGSVVSP